jgi:hypothetical protein
MAEDPRTNQRFAPEWDSEDTSALDDDDDEIRDQTAARTTETGAVIGVIGGAVVGALAGGPVGAVIGGVLGGVGGGAGVAAVEKYEHGTDEQQDVDTMDDDVVDTQPTAIATPSGTMTDTTRSTSMSPETREAMSSPYPGDAGRPEAVQFNGVGIYDAPEDEIASENVPAQADILPTAQTGVALPETETGAEPVRNIASPAGQAMFTLDGYADAQQVSVAGTFNNWSPTSNLMQSENGMWTTSISLAPGKYQYKFVVDGRWMNDPKNPESVDDGSGNLNSILVVDRDIVNQDAILGGDYIAATTAR